MSNRAAIEQDDLPIVNIDYDLNNYENIVVGVPSWANHPAPYYISYLRRAKGKDDKRFAVFITGGRDPKTNLSTVKVMKDEMTHLGINKIVAELILKMRRGKIVDKIGSIDTFIDKIGG
jgi:hypothetical protein